jgi:hypothetical protein
LPRVIASSPRVVSENYQLFNFQHLCRNAFFQWVFFNKFRNVNRSLLASRLLCEGLEAAGGRVENGYVFNRLPVANSWEDSSAEE